MIPSIALVILIILPALAHESALDVVTARLKRIHDIPSLYEEIDAEGERAVLSIGIIPAIYMFSANVERFLGEHKDFAMEFGHFARRASYLAKMHLYKVYLDRGFKASKELASAVTDFERWLERMRQRGLITFDPEEEPIYVRPGVDQTTEALRAIVRLRHNQSAEVPEDPIAGGEISVHVTLPSRILGLLCMTPSDLELDTVEKLLRLLHYVGAVFRLSFRHPHRMGYEDSDRELVVEYLEVTFQGTRESVENGILSSAHWQTDAASLKRVLEWKREHHEL